MILQLFESLAAYVRKDGLHNTDSQLDLEHVLMPVRDSANSSSSG